MNDWMAHEFCLERVEKGHPIRTRISRSKSSWGHFLTLVDNLEKKIFCFYYFALIAKEIAVFLQFLPIGGLFFFFSFLHIFDSSSPLGGPIFTWTTPKNQKFCVDIKRPLSFYSSINFGHKKYTKHFLQVASKPVL